MGVAGCFAWTSLVMPLAQASAQERALSSRSSRYDEFGNNPEDSAYFSPQRLRERMEKMDNWIQGQNARLAYLQGRGDFGASEEYSDQVRRYSVERFLVQGEMKDELEAKRAQTSRQLAQAGGFHFKQFKDGKREWYKNGKVQRVENEKVMQNGRELRRETLDMAYDARGNLAGYRTETRDETGRVIGTSRWEGLYSEGRRRDARLLSFTENSWDALGNATRLDRTNIQWTSDGKKTLSYTDSKTDAYGKVTKLDVSDSTYNPDGQLTSYKEVTLSHTGETFTKIWSDGKYEKNAQDEWSLSSYKESVTDANGRRTEQEWGQAKYDEKGRLTSFTEKNTNAAGKTSTRRWEKGRYDDRGQLTGYEENVTDDKGRTSFRGWEGGRYDENGRIVGYEERTVDADGAAGWRQFKNGEYNSKNEMIGFSEKIMDARGELSEHDWFGKEYQNGLLTHSFETNTDSRGRMTSKDWTGVYGEKDRLASFVETTTDIAGQASTRGQDKLVYDALGRMVSYNETNADAFGIESSQVWTATGFDEDDRVIGYETREKTPAGEQLRRRNNITHTASGRIAGYDEEVEVAGANGTALITKTRWSGAVYGSSGDLLSYHESTTNPAGETSSHQWGGKYDSLGRMVSYVDERTGAAGPPVTVRWSASSFDAFDHATNLTETMQSNGAPPRERSWSGTYDKRGLVTNSLETVRAPNGQTQTTKLNFAAYDKKGRLTDSDTSLRRSDMPDLLSETKVTGQKYDDAGHVIGGSEVTHLTGRTPVGAIDLTITGGTANGTFLDGKLTGYEQTKIILGTDDRGQSVHIQDVTAVTLGQHGDRTDVTHHMAFNAQNQLVADKTTTDRQTGTVQDVQGRTLTAQRASFDNATPDVVTTSQLKNTYGATGDLALSIDDATDALGVRTVRKTENLSTDAAGRTSGNRTTTTRPGMTVTEEVTEQSNMAYDALGRSAGAHEDSTTTGPGLFSHSSVDRTVRYDGAGNAAVTRETGDRNGAALDMTNTNEAYNLSGQATAFHQQGWSADGGVTDDRRSGINYNKYGQADTYTDEGIVGGQYRKNNHTALERDAYGREIRSLEEGINESGKYRYENRTPSFNNLGQATARLETGWKASEGNYTLAQNNIRYDTAGRQLDFDQTKTLEGKTLVSHWASKGYDKNGASLGYLETGTITSGDEAGVAYTEDHGVGATNSLGQVLSYVTINVKTFTDGTTKTSTVKWSNGVYDNAGRLDGYFEDTTTVTTEKDGSTKTARNARERHHTTYSDVSGEPNKDGASALAGFTSGYTETVYKDGEPTKAEQVEVTNTVYDANGLYYDSKTLRGKTDRFKDALRGLSSMLFGTEGPLSKTGQALTRLFDLTEGLMEKVGNWFEDAVAGGRELVRSLLGLPSGSPTDQKSKRISAEKLAELTDALRNEIGTNQLQNLPENLRPAVQSFGAMDEAPILTGRTATVYDAQGRAVNWKEYSITAASPTKPIYSEVKVTYKGTSSQLASYDAKTIDGEKVLHTYRDQYTHDAQGREAYREISFEGDDIKLLPSTEGTETTAPKDPTLGVPSNWNNLTVAQRSALLDDIYNEKIEVLGKIYFVIPDFTEYDANGIARNVFGHRVTRGVLFHDPSELRGLAKELADAEEKAKKSVEEEYALEPIPLAVNVKTLSDQIKKGEETKKSLEEALAYTNESLIVVKSGAEKKENDIASKREEIAKLVRQNVGVRDQLLYNAYTGQVDNYLEGFLRVYVDSKGQLFKRIGNYDDEYNVTTVTSESSLGYIWDDWQKMGLEELFNTDLPEGSLETSPLISQYRQLYSEVKSLESELGEARAYQKVLEGRGSNLSKVISDIAHSLDAARLVRVTPSIDYRLLSPESGALGKAESGILTSLGDVVDLAVPLLDPLNKTQTSHGEIETVQNQILINADAEVACEQYGCYDERFAELENERITLQNLNDQLRRENESNQKLADQNLAFYDEQMPLHSLSLNLSSFAEARSSVLKRREELVQDRDKKLENVRIESAAFVGEAARAISKMTFQMGGRSVIFSQSDMTSLLEGKDVELNGSHQTFDSILSSGLIKESFHHEENFARIGGVVPEEIRNLSWTGNLSLNGHSVGVRDVASLKTIADLATAVTPQVRPNLAVSIPGLTFNGDGQFIFTRSNAQTQDGFGRLTSQTNETLKIARLNGETSSTLTTQTTQAYRYDNQGNVIGYDRVTSEPGKNPIHETLLSAQYDGQDRQRASETKIEDETGTYTIKMTNDGYDANSRPINAQQVKTQGTSVTVSKAVGSPITDEWGHSLFNASENLSTTLDAWSNNPDFSSAVGQRSKGYIWNTGFNATGDVTDSFRVTQKASGQEGSHFVFESTHFTYKPASAGQEAGRLATSVSKVLEMGHDAKTGATLFRSYTDHNTVTKYSATGQALFQTTLHTENGVTKTTEDNKARQYDEFGRLMETDTTTTDASGLKTRNFYKATHFDQAGRATSFERSSYQGDVKTFEEKVTDATYDANGNLLGQNSKISEWDEDGKGLKTSTKTERGNTYNLFGQLIKSDTTTTRHDSNGATITDTKETKYEYDLSGRVVKTTVDGQEVNGGAIKPCNSEQEILSWDIFGRAARTRNTSKLDGLTTQKISLQDIKYDEKGRVISGRDLVHSNGEGYSKYTEEALDVNSEDFDTWGRATKYTQTLVDGGLRTTSTISVTYDADGLVSSQTTNVLETSINALLNHHVERTIKQTDMKYDALGNLVDYKKVVKEGDLETTYKPLLLEYDQFGRPTTALERVTDNTGPPGRDDILGLVGSKYNSLGQLIESPGQSVTVKGTSKALDNYGNLEKVVAGIKAGAFRVDHDEEGKRLVESLGYQGVWVNQTTEPIRYDEQGRAIHNYTVMNKVGWSTIDVPVTEVLFDQTADKHDGWKYSDALEKRKNELAKMYGDVKTTFEWEGSSKKHRYCRATLTYTKKVAEVESTHDISNLDVKVFDALNRPLVQTATTFLGRNTTKSDQFLTYNRKGQVAEINSVVTEDGYSSDGKELHHTYSQKQSFTYNTLGQSTNETTQTWGDSQAPNKITTTSNDITYGAKGERVGWQETTSTNDKTSVDVRKVTNATYDGLGRLSTYNAAVYEQTGDTKKLLYVDQDVLNTYDNKGRLASSLSHRRWGDGTQETKTLAPGVGAQATEPTDTTGQPGGGISGLDEGWTSGNAVVSTTYQYGKDGTSISGMTVTATGTGTNTNSEVQAMGIHLTYKQSNIKYDTTGRATSYHLKTTQIEHYDYFKQVQKGLKRKNAKKSGTGSITTESVVTVLEFDGFGRQTHTIVESQKNDMGKSWSRTDTTVKSFDESGRVKDVDRKTESRMTVVGGGHGFAKTLAKAAKAFPMLNVVFISNPWIAAYVASGSLGGQTIHSYGHTVAQNQYKANGTLDEEATKAKTTTLEEYSYQQGKNYGDKVMQAVDISMAVAAVVLTVVSCGALAPLAFALASMAIAAVSTAYRMARQGISTHDLGMFGKNHDRAEAKQNAMGFYSGVVSVAVAGAGAWMSTVSAFTATAGGIMAARTVTTGMQVLGQMAVAKAGGANSKTMWTVAALTLVTSIVNGGRSGAGSGAMTGAQQAFAIGGSLVTNIGLTYGKQSQRTTWMALGSGLSGASGDMRGIPMSVMKTFAVQLYAKKNDGSGLVDQDKINQGLITQAVGEAAGSVMDLGTKLYGDKQIEKKAALLGISPDQYRQYAAAQPLAKTTFKSFLSDLGSGLLSPLKALAGFAMALQKTPAVDRSSALANRPTIGSTGQNLANERNIGEARMAEYSDILAELDPEFGRAYLGGLNLYQPGGDRKFEGSPYPGVAAERSRAIDLDLVSDERLTLINPLRTPISAKATAEFQSVLSFGSSQKQFDVLALELGSQRQGLALSFKKQADVGTSLQEKQVFYSVAMNEIERQLVLEGKTGLANSMKDGNISEMLNSLPGVNELRSLFSGRLANLDTGTIAKAPMKALELLLGPAGPEMERAGRVATLYILKDLMTEFKGRIGKESAALTREGNALKAAEVNFKAAEAAFGELKALMVQGVWTEKIQNRFNALIGAVRLNQIGGQMELLRVRVINGSADFQERLGGLYLSDAEKGRIGKGIDALLNGPQGVAGVKKAAMDLLGIGNLADGEAWKRVESLVIKTDDLFERVGGMQRAFDLAERISDVQVSTALFVAGVSKKLDGFWAKMTYLGWKDISTATQVVKDTLLGGNFGKEWVAGHIDTLEKSLKLDQMMGEALSLTTELALTFGAGAVLTRSAEIAVKAANFVSKTGVMAKALSKSLEALSVLGNGQKFLKTAGQLGGIGGLLSVGIEQMKAAVFGREVFQGVDMLGRTITTKERGWIGWDRAGSAFAQGAKGGLGFVKWTPLAEAAAVLSAGKMPRTFTYRAERGAANFAGRIEEEALDAGRGLTLGEKTRIVAAQKTAGGVSLVESMAVGMGADHVTAWAVEKGAKAVGLSETTSKSLGQSMGGFVGGVSMGMVGKYRGRDIELAQDFVNGKYEAGTTYVVDIQSPEALVLFKKAADRNGKDWIKNKVEVKPNVDPNLLSAMQPADIATYGKWLNQGEATALKTEFIRRETVMTETRVRLDAEVDFYRAKAARYEKAADTVDKTIEAKENILVEKKQELAVVNREIERIEKMTGGEASGVLQTPVQQGSGWFASLGEKINRFLGRIPSVDAKGNAGLPEGSAGGSDAGRRGNQKVESPTGEPRPIEGLLRPDGTAPEGYGTPAGSLGEGIERIIERKREQVVRRGEQVVRRKELSQETGKLTDQISRLKSVRSGLLEKAGGFKARSEDSRRSSVDLEGKRMALRENRLALDSSVNDALSTHRSAVELTVRPIPDRPMFEPTGLLARAGILWDKATVRKAGNYEMFPASSESAATLFVVASDQTPLSAFSRLGKELKSEYVVAVRLSNGVGAKPEITLFDVAAYGEKGPVMTLSQVAMGGKEVPGGGIQFDDFREAVRLLGSHAAVNGKPIMSRTAFFENIRNSAPTLSAELQGYISQELSSSVKKGLTNTARQWLMGDDSQGKKGFLHNALEKIGSVVGNERGEILVQPPPLREVYTDLKNKLFGKVSPSSSAEGPPVATERSQVALSETRNELTNPDGMVVKPVLPQKVGGEELKTGTPTGSKSRELSVLDQLVLQKNYKKILPEEFLQLEKSLKAPDRIERYVKDSTTGATNLQVTNPHTGVVITIDGKGDVLSIHDPSKTPRAQSPPLNKANAPSAVPQAQTSMQVFQPKVKPEPIVYEGAVYRYEKSTRKKTTWTIHEGNIRANHRYSEPGKGAVYGGTSPETAKAEIDHYNAASGRVLMSKQVKIDRVLDLTSPMVRQQLGISLDSIAGNDYRLTHDIGDWARQNGYQGILAPSARSRAGSNLIIFEDLK